MGCMTDPANARFGEPHGAREGYRLTRSEEAERPADNAGYAAPGSEHHGLRWDSEEFGSNGVFGPAPEVSPADIPAYSPEYLNGTAVATPSAPAGLPMRNAAGNSAPPPLPRREAAQHNMFASPFDADFDAAAAGQPAADSATAQSAPTSGFPPTPAGGAEPAASADISAGSENPTFAPPGDAAIQDPEDTVRRIAESLGINPDRQPRSLGAHRDGTTAAGGPGNSAAEPATGGRSHSDTSTTAPNSAASDPTASSVTERASSSSPDAREAASPPASHAAASAEAASPESATPPKLPERLPTRPSERSDIAPDTAAPADGPVATTASSTTTPAPESDPPTSGQTGERPPAKATDGPDAAAPNGPSHRAAPGSETPLPQRHSHSASNSGNNPAPSHSAHTGESEISAEDHESTQDTATFPAIRDRGAGTTAAAPVAPARNGKKVELRSAPTRTIGDLSDTDVLRRRAESETDAAERRSPHGSSAHNATPDRGTMSPDHNAADTTGRRTDRSNGSSDADPAGTTSFSPLAGSEPRRNRRAATDHHTGETPEHIASRAGITPTSRRAARRRAESPGETPAIDVGVVMQLLLASHTLENVARNAETGDVDLDGFITAAHRTRAAAVELVTTWFGGTQQMREFAEALLAATES